MIDMALGLLAFLAIVTGSIGAIAGLLVVLIDRWITRHTTPRNVRDMG